MVSSKDTFTITPRIGVAKKLRQILEGEYGHGKKFPTLSLATVDLLEKVCTVKEFIDGQYYHLSVVGKGQEILWIEDKIRNIRAEVQIGYDANMKSHRLYCRLDESFCCEHVGYAATRPETAELREIKKLAKPKSTVEREGKDKEKSQVKKKLMPVIARAK